MSFWKAMGGAIAGGVASGVASELASLEKKPHKPHKPKPHRPKNGNKDPKVSSTHSSEAPSKKLENSSVGEKEGLLRSANLTDLASSLGIGNKGVLKNGTLVQMSNPSNLTSINGTAELSLRPRSITAELGDGRAVIGQQNPASFFIFGIVAILLVATLALAALRFRRQKRKYELVEAIDTKQAQDIVWAIV